MISRGLSDQLASVAKSPLQPGLERIQLTTLHFSKQLKSEIELKQLGMLWKIFGLLAANLGI